MAQLDSEVAAPHRHETRCRLFREVLAVELQSGILRLLPCLELDETTVHALRHAGFSRYLTIIMLFRASLALLLVPPPIVQAEKSNQTRHHSIILHPNQKAVLGYMILIDVISPKRPNLASSNSTEPPARL